MKKQLFLEQKEDKIKLILQNKMGNNYDEEFVEDIFLLDPTINTNKKYISWLQKQYYTGQLTEDNYTNVKIWLDTYNKLSERQLLPTDVKDITTLTIPMLENIHNEMKDKLTITRQDVNKQDELERLKSIFGKQIETDNWYIIDVKTREDQIEQGRHTKWCIQGTNTQGKTLKDIYRQEFQDVWKDDRLSEIMNYIMRSMGVQPVDEEDKFEQFYQMQQQQIPRMEQRYLSREEIRNLDEVSKQYKLLFIQYKQFENRDGDGHIWQQIYKPNPFLKFQFIFGIGEYRDQENNSLDMQQFSNLKLTTQNKEHDIPPNQVQELITFFSKYPKQKQIITKQKQGEYIPDYVDYIRENMF